MGNAVVALVRTMGPAAISVSTPEIGQLTARGALYKNVRLIICCSWGGPVHIHVSGPEKEEQHCIFPLQEQERREHAGVES